MRAELDPASGEVAIGPSEVQNNGTSDVLMESAAFSGAEGVSGTWTVGVGSTSVALEADGVAGSLGDAEVSRGSSSPLSMSTTFSGFAAGKMVNKSLGSLTLTFTCPTDVAITNNSVVPVAVKSYTVADQTAGKAHAVAAAAFDASKDSNAWVNNVVAKAGDKATASASAALNLDQGTLPAAWNMGTTDSLYKETQDEVLSLTLDSKMKNLDGQIDFNTKTDLAKVTFTFDSVMNA